MIDREPGEALIGKQVRIGLDPEAGAAYKNREGTVDLYDGQHYRVIFTDGDFHYFDFAEFRVVDAYPDNNPKAAVGATKLPVHLVPPALMLGVAEAMADGAAKYGAYNFRESAIAADVYMGAMLRHIFAWWDGEEVAQDSGIHHLKHAAACIGLVLDTMEVGNFVDNRPPKSGAGRMIAAYSPERPDGE